MTDIDGQVDLAAAVIEEADALLIGAGAGMGVDSGLPDFRGDQGFWKAYPPFRGRRFAEMSNPVWFERDPRLAWGFFGHRLQLYRDAEPHDGFRLLREWGARCRHGAFVFTSNVDGQFQKAGFDGERMLEVHGSIHQLQCTGPCSREIWAAEELSLAVDMDEVRALSQLPKCRKCGAVARPNILMFGDCGWLSARTGGQENRYVQWLAAVDADRLAIIEIGAGLAVPTVRYECESRGGTLIRLNPRDAEVPPGAIGIPLGGLEGLRRIAERLDCD